MGLSTLLKKKVQFVLSNNTVIAFDAVMKETHSRKSTFTRFPVEDGTGVSDHVILEPFDLELTAIISDTPIKAVQDLLSEVPTSLISSLTPPSGVVNATTGFALFNALSKSASPSIQAYVKILQQQETKLPFNVITKLFLYKSMWINELSVPRTSDNGEYLEYNIKLSQLILVKPQTIDVGVFANPSLSAGQEDLGKQGLEQSVNGFPAGQAAADKAITRVQQ